MTYASICDGIGAVHHAWAPLGWECKWVSEIDRFPAAVVGHNFGFPNLGDLRKLTAEGVAKYGHLDLVVAGFPCQDLSVAGNRKGLKNADGSTTRSGLFFAIVALCDAIGQRWTVLENVPGLLSSNKGEDFGTVVGTLCGATFDVPPGGWATAGVAVGPKGLVEWRILDAQYAGVPQRRRRVFIVRDSGNWAGRPPVLLIPSCLQGYPPPSREAGKRVAGAISARTQGGGGLGTDFELGGLVPEHCAQKPTQVTAKTPTTTSLRGGCFDVAPTLDAHYGDKQGLDNQHIDAGGGCSSVAKSLNSHGGRFDYETETFVTVGPLQSGGTPNGHGTAGINRQAVNSGHIIAIQERAISENEAAGPDGVGIREDGQAYTLEARTVPQAVAFESRYVRTPTMAVRRLTPRECERLQGHPDDSTLIQHRGKPATDGPRYKALGNSMVVPELRWIGERIAMVDALTMEVDK